MRIIYTLGLLIGVPFAVMLLVCVMAALDDWMTKRFGKPPLWLGVIGVACILWPLVRLAWEQAGKWVK
jgi:hypothetical protein